MGILHKKIKIKVTNRIIKKLKDLGYDINNEIIEIWQEDFVKLSPTSKTKIEVECDNCHKVWNMIVQNITRKRKYVNGYIFCKNCSGEYVRKNFHDEIRVKAEQTYLGHYGVNHNFKVEDCLKKREETWLKRYGVKNAAQSEEVKEKRAQTLYRNGTVPTSDEQRHICKLFNGDLNKPIGYYSADIVIETSGMKLDIEFDGWAHKKHVVTGKVSIEEFWQEENNRNEYILNHGYKILRLVANNDKLPDDNILIKITNDCVNQLISGKDIIYFDIEKLEMIN